MLKEFGYTVIEAIDGEDAVKQFMLHKDNIHLLLFDFIMPKKNGKTAYDEINKVCPGLKALFLSGYAPDIIRQKLPIGQEGIQISVQPDNPDEPIEECPRSAEPVKRAPDACS